MCDLHKRKRSDVHTDSLLGEGSSVGGGKKERMDSSTSAATRGVRVGGMSQATGNIVGLEVREADADRWKKRAYAQQSFAFGNFLFAKKGSKHYIVFIPQNMSTVQFIPGPTQLETVFLIQRTKDRTILDQWKAAEESGRLTSCSDLPPLFEVVKDENQDGTRLPGDEFKGHVFCAELKFRYNVETDTIISDSVKKVQDDLFHTFLNSMAVAHFTCDNHFLPFRDVSLVFMFDVEKIIKHCEVLMAKILGIADISETKKNHATQALVAYSQMLKRTPYMHIRYLGDESIGLFLDNLKTSKVRENFNNLFVLGNNEAVKFLNEFTFTRIRGKGKTLNKKDISGFYNAFIADVFDDKKGLVFQLPKDLIIALALQEQTELPICNDFTNYQKGVQSVMDNLTSAVKNKADDEVDEECDDEIESDMVVTPVKSETVVEVGQSLAQLQNVVSTLNASSTKVLKFYTDAVTSGDYFELFRGKFVLMMHSCKLTMSKPVIGSSGHEVCSKEVLTDSGTGKIVEVEKCFKEDVSSKAKSKKSDDYKVFDRGTVDVQDIQYITETKVKEVFKDPPHWPFVDDSEVYYKFHENTCYFHNKELHPQIRKHMKHGFGPVIGMYYISTEIQIGVQGQLILLDETLEAIKSAQPRFLGTTFNSLLENFQSKIRNGDKLYISSLQLMTCGVYNLNHGFSKQCNYWIKETPSALTTLQLCSATDNITPHKYAVAERPNMIAVPFICGMSLDSMIMMRLQGLMHAVYKVDLSDISYLSYENRGLIADSQLRLSILEIELSSVSYDVSEAVKDYDTFSKSSNRENIMINLKKHILEKASTYLPERFTMEGAILFLVMNFLRGETEIIISIEKYIKSVVQRERVFVFSAIVALLGLFNAFLTHALYFCTQNEDIDDISKACFKIRNQVFASSDDVENFANNSNIIENAIKISNVLYRDCVFHIKDDGIAAFSELLDNVHSTFDRHVDKLYAVFVPGEAAAAAAPAADASGGAPGVELERKIFKIMELAHSVMSAD